MFSFLSFVGLPEGTEYTPLFLDSLLFLIFTIMMIPKNHKDIDGFDRHHGLRHGPWIYQACWICAISELK